MQAQSLNDWFVKERMQWQIGKRTDLSGDSAAAIRRSGDCLRSNEAREYVLSCHENEEECLERHRKRGRGEDVVQV